MPIRPRRSQRGRVILLGAGALFVVLQLSSRILFDYCWPQVRFPTFHDQVRRFDALPVPPTILCLGSSRTGCLLKEAEIGQVVEEFTGDTAAFCFNAQLPNGDLIVSERMLRTLLERGARPRFALIELCPEGVNHRNGWLVHYVAWMLRWEDIPTYLKDMAVTGNLVRFAGTRIIPLYVYRYQIRLQLGALACDWCEQRPLPQPLTPEGRAAGVRPSSVGVTAYWQQRIAESLHEATIDPNRNLTIGVENVQRRARLPSRRQRGGGIGTRADLVPGACHRADPLRAAAEQHSPRLLHARDRGRFPGLRISRHPQTRLPLPRLPGRIAGHVLRGPPSRDA